MKKETCGSLWLFHLFQKFPRWASPPLCLPWHSRDRQCKSHVFPILLASFSHIILACHLTKACHNIGFDRFLSTCFYLIFFSNVVWKNITYKTYMFNIKDIHLKKYIVRFENLVELPHDARTLQPPGGAEQKFRQSRHGIRAAVLGCMVLSSPTCTPTCTVTYITKHEARSTKYFQVTWHALLFMEYGNRISLVLPVSLEFSPKWCRPQRQAASSHPRRDPCKNNRCISSHFES